VAEAEIIRDATSMWDLIDRRATLSPDRPMLIDESDRTVTFGEFRDRVERVAAGLAAAYGIGEGTTVAWQLPTRVDTIVLSSALARLGAVQSPILHLYREREVGFSLRQTGAELFFVPGEFRGFDFVELAESVNAGLEHPPKIVVVDADHPLPEGDPATLDALPAVAKGEAPVRWIYYTSGSTSDPKGVQHTDQTLIAGGWGLAKALDMSPDDVGSMAFPYAHIAGPDYLVTMLCLGFPAVVVEAFVIADALPFYRRHGVTMAGGGPAFYVMFLGEQRKQPDEPILPTLRLMSGGGGPKAPEHHFAVQREIGGRGIVHGYGMTEVPMIANGSPTDTDEQLANTDGSPIEGIEVRMVTIDGCDAAPGEEGEVRVKGPMVFEGYLDPALDEEAFDEQGYFRTGDLGILRPDGHLSLTGRLKDVIVRKGENISAKEIEDVLAAHPKVADVAVIGVPDAERGERVCAVVQPADAADPLTFDEMARCCRDAKLMTQKIPEQLEVRADMPRASIGKIVKKDLRAEYAAKAWPGTST
jgi:acyl-CoA synthetase (AMP-forming)/AMP-acid ligase II